VLVFISDFPENEKTVNGRLPVLSAKIHFFVETAAS